MLIACPYCGPRDLAEFTRQAEADRSRPDPASTDVHAWNAYVYARRNEAGPHHEYWQHNGGCRAHLVIERDTLTHDILSVALARDAAATVPSATPGVTAAPRRKRGAAASQVAGPASATGGKKR